LKRGEAPPLSYGKKGEDENSLANEQAWTL